MNSMRRPSQRGYVGSRTRETYYFGDVAPSGGRQPCIELRVRSRPRDVAKLLAEGVGSGRGKIAEGRKRNDQELVTMPPPKARVGLVRTNPESVRDGAGDGTRTRDALLGRQVLYQLSYSRVGENGASPRSMVPHQLRERRWSLPGVSHG